MKSRLALSAVVLGVLLTVLWCGALLYGLVTVVAAAF